MTIFSNTATRAVVGFTGIAIGAMICFGAAATPAQARGADQPPTVRVSYAGLDLRSVAGRHELDRRLHHAAQQVCDTGVTGATDIKLSSAEQKCIRSALSNVRQPVADQTAAR